MWLILMPMCESWFIELGICSNCYVLWCRNGDTYAGEYFADKMHGFGVYQFANGHRYEGAWHEGRRQGLGMYTFRNGETQSGYWQNGVIHVPSTHNSDPGSPYAANNSKVLNAVQVTMFVCLMPLWWLDMLCCCLKWHWLCKLNVQIVAWSLTLVYY